MAEKSLPRGGLGAFPVEIDTGCVGKVISGALTSSYGAAWKMVSRLDVELLRGYPIVVGRGIDAFVGEPGAIRPAAGIIL